MDIHFLLLIQFSQDYSNILTDIPRLLYSGSNAINLNYFCQSFDCLLCFLERLANLLYPAIGDFSISFYAPVWLGVPVSKEPKQSGGRRISRPVFCYLLFHMEGTNSSKIG